MRFSFRKFKSQIHAHYTLHILLCANENIVTLLPEFKPGYQIMNNYYKCNIIFLFVIMHTVQNKRRCITIYANIQHSASVFFFPKIQAKKKIIVVLVQRKSKTWLDFPFFHVILDFLVFFRYYHHRCYYSYITIMIILYSYMRLSQSICHFRWCCYECECE